MPIMFFKFAVRSREEFAVSCGKNAARIRPNPKL